MRPLDARARTLWRIEAAIAAVPILLFAAGVAWVPHRIADASGVGTQIAVGDLSGDGRPDIVVGNKRGGCVFLQESGGR